ncbi:MAG: protease pro-enzyme activation domain-containing protein [Vulcanimicrobiaceae bacterium]
MRPLEVIRVLCALGVLATLGAARFPGTGGALPAIPAQLDLGPRASNAPAQVVVVLAHRNEAQLDALVEAIEAGRARPISHAQFAAEFGPDPAASARVAAALQAAGLRITSVQGPLVIASGSTAYIERTFGTTLHNVRASPPGDWYAPATAVRIPANLGDAAAVVLSHLPLARAR